MPGIPFHIKEVVSPLCWKSPGQLRTVYTVFEADLEERRKKLLSTCCLSSPKLLDNPVTKSQGVYGTFPKHVSSNITCLCGSLHMNVKSSRDLTCNRQKFHCFALEGGPAEVFI